MKLLIIFVINPHKTERLFRKTISGLIGSSARKPDEYRCSRLRRHEVSYSARIVEAGAGIAKICMVDFVSLDYCCRGMDSDYNLVVSRSRNVEGPYVDRDVKLMSRGGGTPVAKGNADWAGVGHNSAYTLDGKSIIVMHG